MEKVVQLAGELNQFALAPDGAWDKTEHVDREEAILRFAESSRLRVCRLQ
jgi:hypothetical protein